MKADKIFHQKVVLNHDGGKRQAIFEFVVWEIDKIKDYPQGIKYRAWLAEKGETVFGFDNHKPKGPHLHVGQKQVGYVYRGLKALRNDIIAMIKKEGFIYED